MEKEKYIEEGREEKIIEKQKGNTYEKNHEEEIIEPGSALELQIEGQRNTIKLQRGEGHTRRGMALDE